MVKLMSNDQPNHKEAEAIDRKLTRVGLHGESKCRKRRRDYWDLNIHIIKTKLLLWSQLKRRRKMHLFTHALCTRAKSLGVEMDNTSNEEVEQIIQSLIIEMKQHFKEETERRDEFMLNQANLAAEAGEEEKANAIRNIRTCERKNKAYKKFKFHLGKDIQSQAINRIQIPTVWGVHEEYKEDDELNWIDPKQVNKNDDNAWRTITTPKEIEFYLQKQNQLHFGQAETDQTPFTMPDMKHEFHWSASTNSAELVLQGEYTNP